MSKWILSITLSLLLITITTAAPADAPKSRQFQFTYAVQIKELPKDKVAKIWVPVPTSSFEQDVKLVRKDVPKQARFARDRVHGNRMLYVESNPDENGVLELSLTYRITRREVSGPIPSKENEALLRARCLGATAMIPLQGKPLDYLKGVTLPEDAVKKARVFYDIVLKHVDYDKSGTGWGRGDVLWVCDHGKGNCSDFHSLFLSLARSQKIPAEFEIGFPLPTKRGKHVIPGYHCWAKFYVAGKGWIAIDASEADKHPKMTEYYFGNLTEDRVRFSVGRDLTLVPAQKSGPINFFIYPHVEVEGKAHPIEKIGRTFTAEDVK